MSHFPVIYGDHVKTETALFRDLHPHSEMIRCSADLSLFRKGYRFFRIAAVAALPVLYFRKYIRILLICDDIDLSELTSVISRTDIIAFLFQQAAREIFTAVSFGSCAQIEFLPV